MQRPKDYSIGNLGNWELFFSVLESKREKSGTRVWSSLTSSNWFDLVL